MSTTIGLVSGRCYDVFRRVMKVYNLRFTYV